MREPSYWYNLTSRQSFVMSKSKVMSKPGVGVYKFGLQELKMAQSVLPLDFADVKVELNLNCGELLLKNIFNTEQESNSRPSIGIGALLIHRVAILANKYGVKVIRIDIGGSAMGFYGRMGFVIEQEQMLSSLKKLPLPKTVLQDLTGFFALCSLCGVGYSDEVRESIETKKRGCSLVGRTVDVLEASGKSVEKHWKLMAGKLIVDLPELMDNLWH